MTPPLPDPTAPPSAGVAFELLGRAIGLETPTADVASTLARVLPAYAAPLSALRTDERWRVSPHEHGWLVEPRGFPGDVFPSLGEAMEAIEYLVTLRLLALNGTFPQLHAAGVVVPEGAVLAIGESGAGKTSIALGWSVGGLPVLGDDIVLLDRDAGALPFKRLFTVDRARFAAFAVTPDPALQWAAPEGRDEARYDPRAGGGWADGAPIARLALIRRRPGAGLRIEKMSRATALAALTGGLMPSGLPAARCFDLLAAIVERAPAFDVTFEDAGAAADALRALR
jgi:hypothetical protein